MVKITKVEPNYYEVSFETSLSLIIGLIKKEKKKEIVFSIKKTSDELKPESIIYRASYTMDDLIKIHQKFKKYKSTKKLVEEINEVVEKGKIKLVQEVSEIILTLNIFKEPVILTIPSLLSPNISKEPVNNPSNEPANNPSNEPVNSPANEPVNGPANEPEMLEVGVQTEEIAQENASPNPQPIQKEEEETQKVENKPQEIIPNNNINIPGFKLVKVTKDHASFVYCLCFMKDGRIASSSADKTIKIYNSTTFQNELTITGHSEEVFHISLLQNGNLISSSGDKTIKIWEIKKDSWKCIGTLTGHTDVVSKSIQLSNSRIGSCSWDKTIRIWNDTSPYSCIKTLTGHKKKICSIIMLKNRKYIASSALNDSIQFWGHSSLESKFKIDRVSCCWQGSLTEVENGILLVGGWKKISIIDTNDFKLKKVIQLEKIDFVYSISQLSPSRAICGCGEGKVLLFDAVQLKPLDIIENVHDDEIYCVANNGTKLGTCSKDNFIKFFSFS